VIRDREWMRVLGSSELPVRSLQPTIIKTSRYGTTGVYFLDYERLSEVQRGGLRFAFETFTGNADAWEEFVQTGLPLLASDCIPVQ